MSNCIQDKYADPIKRRLSPMAGSWPVKLSHIDAEVNAMLAERNCCRDLFLLPISTKRWFSNHSLL